MWPFEAKRKRSLVGLAAVASVDVTATIVSGDDVSSPFSELRAALVWIEVTESMSLSGRMEIMDAIRTGADLSHFDGDRVLGSVVLGDTLILRTDDAIDVTLCPRRASLEFARTGKPRRADSKGVVSTSPPELEWLLGKASGGEVRYRELGLLHGARVRLRAVVEPTSYVSPTAYRCEAKPSFAVLEDDSPLTIEELPTES